MFVKPKACPKTHSNLHVYEKLFHEQLFRSYEFDDNLISNLILKSTLIRAIQQVIHQLLESGSRILLLTG